MSKAHNKHLQNAVVHLVDNAITAGPYAVEGFRALQFLNTRGAWLHGEPINAGPYFSSGLRVKLL
jgi:hypothetical protein